MRYNFTHDDLKGCPFCGHENDVEVEKKIEMVCCLQHQQVWEARWNVRCTNPFCPVHPKTMDFASLSEAVEAWNKRPSEEMRKQ